MNNFNVIDFVDIETRSVRERGREQQDQWGRQRDVEQSPRGEPPGPGPVTDEDERPVDWRLQQGGALLPDLLHRGGTVEGVQWSVLCINVYNINNPEQNMSCRKWHLSLLISDELTCDESVNIKVNIKTAKHILDCGYIFHF